MKLESRVAVLRHVPDIFKHKERPKNVKDWEMFAKLVYEDGVQEVFGEVASRKGKGRKDSGYFIGELIHSGIIHGKGRSGGEIIFEEDRTPIWFSEGWGNQDHQVKEEELKTIISVELKLEDLQARLKSVQELVIHGPKDAVLAKVLDPKEHEAMRTAIEAQMERGRLRRQ